MRMWSLKYRENPKKPSGKNEVTGQNEEENDLHADRLWYTGVKCITSFIFLPKILELNVVFLIFYAMLPELHFT